MSSKHTSAFIILAALLGIVLTAAITWGTSQLVSQRIGLASEPLTAGRNLLPPSLITSAPDNKPLNTTRTVTTTVRVPLTPPPVITTVVPVPESAPSKSTPTERAPSSREEGSDSNRSGGRDD